MDKSNARRHQYYDQQQQISSAQPRRVTQQDVPPSQHAIFIRGLPASVKAEDVRGGGKKLRSNNNKHTPIASPFALPPPIFAPSFRKFFEENVSECSFDFIKESNDSRWLHVAVRFQSKSTANECMERYRSGQVLGHSVRCEWFRDIRRYCAHLRKSGVEVAHRRQNNYEPISTSTPRQQQPYKGRSSRRSKSSNSSEGHSKSPPSCSPSGGSRSQQSAGSVASHLSNSGGDRASRKVEGSPPRPAKKHKKAHHPHKRGIRKRRHSSSISRSSPSSASSHSSSPSIKSKMSRPSSPNNDNNNAVSEGELSNTDAESAVKVKVVAEKEVVHSPSHSHSADYNNNGGSGGGNDAVSIATKDGSPSTREQSAAMEVQRPVSGGGDPPAPQAQPQPQQSASSIEGLLSTFKGIQHRILEEVHYKTERPQAQQQGLGSFRLSALSMQKSQSSLRKEKMKKLSPELRERIECKKLELELSYRRDCETFALVTRKLIGKDTQLEERLRLALLEVMKDLETEAMSDLDEMIEQACLISRRV